MEKKIEFSVIVEYVKLYKKCFEDELWQECRIVLNKIFIILQINKLEKKDVNAN